jgi:phytoene dehydrogenase-like protein
VADRCAVRGGPGALTAAIAAAAREAGAEIRTGVSVERILVATSASPASLQAGRRFRA